MVGRGWKKILVRLEDELFELLGDSVDKVNIGQIKEKFATLRVYFIEHGLNHKFREKITDLIEVAETASANICEECGEPGSDEEPEGAKKLGWSKTLCIKHHMERK